MAQKRPAPPNHSDEEELEEGEIVEEREDGEKTKERVIPEVPQQAPKVEMSKTKRRNINQIAKDIKRGPQAENPSAFWHPLDTRPPIENLWPNRDGEQWKGHFLGQVTIEHSRPKALELAAAAPIYGVGYHRLVLWTDGSWDFDKTPQCGTGVVYLEHSIDEGKPYWKERAYSSVIPEFGVSGSVIELMAIDSALQCALIELEWTPQERRPTKILVMTDSQDCLRFIQHFKEHSTVPTKCWEGIFLPFVEKMVTLNQHWQVWTQFRWCPAHTDVILPNELADKVAKRAKHVNFNSPLTSKYAVRSFDTDSAEVKDHLRLQNYWDPLRECKVTKWGVEYRFTKSSTSVSTSLVNRATK